MGQEGEIMISNQKKIIVSSVLSVLLVISALFAVQVNANGLLRRGDSGTEVEKVQTQLKQLGYFDFDITGYFGPITQEAVKDFQSACGINADGIVGPQTTRYLDRYMNATTSRSANINRDLIVPWFGKAEKIFGIDDVATITDLETGLQFKVKRTYGYNHADCEALTREDTAIYRRIFGGQFKWEMRAIIVEVNNHKMIASMAGMPHAGRDDKPANAWVSNRSGGFGTGTNLNAIHGNGMNGHFDIHFLGSKTHGTNRIDDRHQRQILRAVEEIK